MADTSHPDMLRLRALLRRVLRSGGTDLTANEERVFVQDHRDVFNLTETTDHAADQGLLGRAFDLELQDFIHELMADGRLTAEEGTRRRSSMYAVAGGTLDLEAVLGLSRNWSANLAG